MSSTPILDDMADVDLDAEHPAEPIDMSAGEVEALAKADWHCEELRSIAAELAENADLFHRAVARLKERFESRRDVLLRAQEWHETPVKDLHAAILARNPLRKSIVLPNGTLKSRTETAPRVEWVDEEAFCAWAYDYDDTLVRVKLAPDRPKVAKALIAKGGRWFTADDGEAVPGIAVIAPRTTFSVVTA